ncbi:MAG: putative amidohydrolase YtcJ, partial [Glaciecola sp.]
MQSLLERFVAIQMTPAPAPTVRPGSDPEARGTLLVADRVVTLGHGRYRAHCLLMRGSRVVWVGDDPSSAPPHQRRINLDGCVVGPAFVDAHVHMTGVGITLTGLDLSLVRSGREMLDAVMSYAGQHIGRVIYGHGYDPHEFPDALPTPDQLAAASGGHPVYLSRADGHSSLVDRHTLSAAPLARSGGIERDVEGRATGVLRREANQIIRRWSVGAMTSIELDAARLAASQYAAKQGIAAVHEMGGHDLMGVDDFDAWALGDWPLDITAYWGGFDLGFVAERDLRQIGGGIYLDGSIGSHTAALESPYADSHLTGELEYDDDTLSELFVEATNAGIQVAVHAVGDAAVRQAVRCWQQAQRLVPEYHGDAVR